MTSLKKIIKAVDKLQIEFLQAQKEGIKNQKKKTTSESTLTLWKKPEVDFLKANWDVAINIEGH